MNEQNFTKQKGAAKVLLLLLFMITVSGVSAQSDRWVGSWSCAPYAAGSGNLPPAPYLKNNTLRQVVRVSIGGNKLRLKFSNKTCATPVTFKSVNVAVSKGGSVIDASTLKVLTFNGNSSVTMSPFSSVTSDAFDFDLEPSMRLAITVYYGEVEANPDLTFHYGSRTDSYILSGDQSTSGSFGGASIVERWYHIHTIDVLGADTSGCVGIIGNSITDGYGLHGGLQNRWTDFLSQKLLNNEPTRQIGVLNVGIGGTNVSGNGATTGLSRYQDDLLAQSGMRWIIVFYGTNDIAGGASIATITNAYQTIIDDAHAMGIKVFGATITPFKGSGHYSSGHEVVRNGVNEWIRTPGNFDACIDFDKAIRNPEDFSTMLAEYSKDWLHPNKEGLEFLGNSVNLEVFTADKSDETLFASAGSDQSLIDKGNSGEVQVKLDGSRSLSWGPDIVSYVWKNGENEIATGERPIVNLPSGIHTLTLTITDVDGNVDEDVVLIAITRDSGVWLEAECGQVGTLWNIETEVNASNGKFITVKPGTNSTGEAPAGDSGLATYVFTVDESGPYNLYARVFCPTPNDDSFWIKMDNGSFKMWNGISAANWQWVKFNVTYNLSSGTHTLTIAYREDGAKLDKLWLTKSEANVPDQGSAAYNCSALSINDTPVKPFKFYPNPVSDNLQIALSCFPSNVSLFNTNGQKLFSQNSFTANMTIDMENYLSGIYILKVLNPTYTGQELIIKN